MIIGDKNECREAASEFVGFDFAEASFENKAAAAGCYKNAGNVVYLNTITDPSLLTPDWAYSGICQSGNIVQRSYFSLLYFKLLSKSVI